MFAEIKPDEVPLDRRWRYHKIERGTCLKGWVIGRMIIAVVHWSDPHSRPCRAAMTGGRLPCKCREEKLPTRKIGYVPVFTQSKERVVVIVSNTVCSRVEKLDHGAPTQFKRSTIPCTPVAVEEWPSYEVNNEQTKRIKTWGPADIQSWLLHLWQDDVLTGYFAALRSASEHASTVVENQTNAASVLPSASPARDDVVSLKTPLIRRRPRKDSA